MEKKEKKFCGPLNITILLVQLESFINKTNEQIKEKNKELLIKILIAIAPITLGFIAYMISKENLPLLAGATFTGFSNITLQIGEMRRFIKNQKKLMNKLNTEGASNNLQTSQIRNVEEDMFFSETLKEEINRNETEIIRKHREKLERRRNELTLVTDKVEKPLTKENQIAEILDEIELLQILYNLPPINIELEEWNIFLGAIYDNLNEKELQNHFKELMLTVCNLTISKALVNNQELISIYDFLENLCYFEKNKRKKDKVFEKKELLVLKRKIATEINSLKANQLKLC